PISELRPNIGYTAAAVTVKTIQSLHGANRAQPERRSVALRGLTAAASLERAGYAETCVIAPQTARTENRQNRHPSPTREAFNQSAGGRSTRTACNGGRFP